MKKIILILKLVLRSKFIFKTPEKCDLILFDEMSIHDLSITLSKYKFFVLQTRLESAESKVPLMREIYFSYKILKKIIKNFFKGNLLTVYFISLIELIKPKVVITNIDNSLKFSEVAKILEEKTNFIAIQNGPRYDFLDWDYLHRTKKMKYNRLKKFYIPNFLCFGDYDRELYNRFNIPVKNFYPIGNLRLANYFHYMKTENDISEKYNCDICLIAEVYYPVSSKYELQAIVGITCPKDSDLNSIAKQNSDVEKGWVDFLKYSIKFCIKHNMKTIIPLKKDKKHAPRTANKEIEFFRRNLNKEEFDFVQKNIMEKDTKKFTSFRTVMSSKVTISPITTLLRDKLATGGKILACNLTKQDRLNFPINGICSLNNCSYEEFEKRLLEIYSMSQADYFSKIDKKPDYAEKFDKNYSTIDLIREQLYQRGVRQNY